MMTVVMAAALVVTAAAAPKTVTLDVPGMTCETCPITVKLAISKVSGVNKVAVSFEKREAVVTFDDAKTTIDAVLKATKDAGYPATVKDRK
ncbi:MAG: mercury resistance system periplasmic binding protein MerP [Vicinamibacterales bacterium]